MGLKTRLSDIFNRYGFTKQAFSLCYESVLLHDARLCFQAGCTGALLNVVLFLCATQFGILSSGKYVYLASCIVYAAVAFAEWLRKAKVVAAEQAASGQPAAGPQTAQKGE